MVPKSVDWLLSISIHKIEFLAFLNTWYSSHIIIHEVRSGREFLSKQKKLNHSSKKKTPCTDYLDHPYRKSAYGKL
jgi:hypothetical protein